MSSPKIYYTDSQTVYVDGDKRTAFVPTAHKTSLAMNKVMVANQVVMGTENHPKDGIPSKVCGFTEVGIDNRGPYVVPDGPIPRDIRGISPGFVPIDRDENGLVKSYYLDHIAFITDPEEEPAMPFADWQLALIEGSQSTTEDDDMTSNAELEAELMLKKKEAAKLEKKLETMEAKIADMQKANDETGKELKERLKEEKARTAEYELREKKKLLEQLTDDNKLLFGEKEEDQLKASINELERAVAMTKPKEQEPAAEDDAAGQAEGAPEDAAGQPAGEPGKKMKLPPGVPPPEGAPDPEQARLEYLRDIDKVARKKFGHLPPDTEGYDKVDTTKHSDYFAQYNINK